jgi:endonuclease/exonuclease/phosphatase family metal-dependent hydrolase
MCVFSQHRWVWHRFLYFEVDMFRTSLGRRIMGVHKRSTLALALSALALIAGPLTYAATSPDIVLYAADVTVMQGNWTRTQSSSANPTGTMSSADVGWSAVSAPVVAPAHYFEIAFQAPADTVYHVWLRLRGAGDSKWNESVWVQFSDALLPTGSPIYGVGSSSALLVNLEGCNECGVSDWGWRDSSYWLKQSALIKFASSGLHTIRVQTREDGVSIDQIVLSPVTYLANAPGPDMNDGTIAPKQAPAVLPSLKPYGGTPRAVPGTIEATHFDEGGQGVAYSDRTKGNSGNRFRNTDVDIQDATGGGYNVHWISAGEWLKYSVNVAAAGDYTVSFRVASLAGGTMNLAVNRVADAPMSVTVPSVPPTGGWQMWTNVEAPVHLKAGAQVLAVQFPTGGLNFRSMTLTAAASAPPNEPPAEGSDLRVMTWNINHGRNSAGAYNPVAQAEFIASQQPDVVVLQEINTLAEDQPARFTALLQQFTGVPWSVQWAPVTSSAQTEGNVVLTRLPVVSAGSYQTHATGDWTSVESNRSVAQTTVLVAGAAVHVFSTQLDADTTRNSAQLADVMAWAQRFEGARIVGGDFNTSDESWLTAMMSDYYDTWLHVRIKALSSTSSPTVRRNYLFRSRESNAVEGVNVVVPATTLSVHHPVVADYAVAPDPNSVTITSNCGAGDGADCTVTTMPQVMSGVASASVTSVSGASPTCTPATWTASGTTAWSSPALSCAAGVTKVTVTASDSTGQLVTAAQTITYTPPPPPPAPVSITTTSCLRAQVGTPYSCTVSATGGDGTYTWTEVGSQLNTGACAGLTMSQVDQRALIIGTPTVTSSLACEFALKVDEGVQAATSKAFLIAILAAGKGPHAYFDTISALPEVHKSSVRSLRNQTQLNALTSISEVAGTTPWRAGASAKTPWWTYDVGGDERPDKQDAAKLHIPRLRPMYQCLVVYGKVTITGTPGTGVPKSTLLTNTATGYTYRTAAALTIPANGVARDVRINVASPKGAFYLAQIPAGTAVTFTPAIAKVDAKAVVESNAVKVRCTDGIPTTAQLRIPIGVGGPGSTDTVLLTWDFFYTPEWVDSKWSSIKSFKPQVGSTPTDTKTGWTMLVELGRNLLSVPSTIGPLHMAMGGKPQPQGMTRGKPYAPTGPGALASNTYQIRRGVWTRHWMEIKVAQPASAFTEWNAMVCTGTSNPCTGAGGKEIAPNSARADGTYFMVTIWTADEDREPVLTHYRVPVGGAHRYISRFDFEFNVSDVAPSRAGDLFGYARNFVVLRNYSLGAKAHLTDKLIFQKPVR